MKRNLLIAAALGAVVLGGAVAVPAIAQQFGQGPCAGGQGAGMGAGMGQGQGMGQGMMWRAHGHRFGGDGSGMGPGMGIERMCGEDAAARQAAVLAFAEIKLGITDAQKADWKTFTDAVTASKAATTTACETLKTVDPKAPATLPERLGRMETMMTAKYQQMTALLPAVTTLYDKLTPEQKATADQMFPFGGHHGKF